MIIPKFFGEVDMNGQLHFKDRDRFDSYLLTLNGDVEIIVMKAEKTKTMPQLAYYFGVVIKMLSEELGESPEKVHKDMKDMHLKWVTAKPSVSQCTTVEMKEYIDRIKMFAAQELNLNIPDSQDIYV